MTVTPIPSISPSATAAQAEETSLKSAGQRRVNIMWEATQAVLTIMVSGAVIYLALMGQESKTLELAFMAIVTMYFTRTNHTKTGGVGGAEERSPR